MRVPLLKITIRLSNFEGRGTGRRPEPTPRERPVRAGLRTLKPIPRLPRLMTRVAIIGTGHVGLATAIAFAQWGHEVVGADVSEKIVGDLRAGKTTHYEPGLPDALGRSLATGRLSFTTDVEAAVLPADVVFVCVGTPPKKDGSIDLGYVRKAAQTLGRVIRLASAYKVVVVKSTVLPGTTEGIVRAALERASGKKAGTDFGLAVNPEFLREGSAVDDALHPDRIVIGAIDENICDAFGGINVDDVVEGVGLDPRVNPKFMKAGLGFGGSCFPKDVQALVAAARSKRYPTRILTAVLGLNEAQPLRAVRLAETALRSLRGRRVVILGLSFKGGSDDIRESRAIPLAIALLRKGANVVGYDPVVREAFRKAVPRVELAHDLSSALKGADVCIVHNDWPQWRELVGADFQGMRRKIVIDGRRILNRKALDGVRLIVLGG